MKMTGESNYSYFSKIFHSLALGNSTLKKTLFDLDCFVNRQQSISQEKFPPLYIAGLARSGTTLLMEAIYSTGAFASFTYRNMPFILNPYTSTKYLNIFQSSASSKERAHGDKMLINFDSPEAFEEVFWLTYSGSHYLNQNSLKPHIVSEETARLYKKFIANFLASNINTGIKHYLAKNNNNLLRLKSLKKLFPRAIIIVPFRRPLDQASSLLKQHLRFLKIHKEDRFSLKYMNWLGHYEFGQNFKPFNFSSEALPKNDNEPKELNYWLRYWLSTYEYLLNNFKSDVIFFSYDKLCENPKTVLSDLEKLIARDTESFKPISTIIKKPTMYEHEPVDSNLHKRATLLFEKLRTISL